ncbi:ABC protein [Hygrophoropsis aurantiaca]|uniref:ABC protein n=1 Tax=Hygrophoropsis aurantiaca TaxID=72124 RepID=A0ACB8A8W4_9AGAM|nr:ABC protein [Hygrophoropsis aurantiaca]
MASQNDEKSVEHDKDNLKNVKEMKQEVRSSQQPLHLQLDTGNAYVRFRQKWWQLWLPSDPPPPAPASLEDAELIPLANASIFSMLSYTWITDIMILGYQRTLQASDLYKMDPSREAEVMASKLEAAWARRVKVAAEWNERLENGQINPSLYKRTIWAIRCLSSQGEKGGSTWSTRREIMERHWREVDGRKGPSLTWALNDVFGRVFWLGGIFKVIGDTSQLMGPIILRSIINFSEERSAATLNGSQLPNVGRGIAMAIGLFLITVTTSVCTHQFFWRSMTTGVLARAALTAAIYERGVNLTGKARVKLTNATLVNHISTDVSRVDACAQWFHAAWTAPIQVTVCLIILLVELGPSALAGFSLFILIIPVQERVMTLQHRVRRSSMRWTDQRAKILLEVLSAMRVVKYFSYEIPFLQRIFELRKQELRGIRRILHSSSANLALATSLPVLAATLAFVTYTLTAHDFNVAVIFSSLSLFQLLRQPMMFMPRALSAIPDAANALQRLTHVFKADLIEGEALVICKEQGPALLVEDATFEWESSQIPKAEEPKRGKKGKIHEDRKGKETMKASEKDGAGKGAIALFRVKNINLNVTRGQLVAVVGPVGSGKSSLLQGLIGEMRRVSGSVVMGGRVGYCPQTAWIQNATLRDNIIFGQPFDEDKYWRVIEVACLLPDLQLLPDGDLTEIGEKGINLSGGQKQRVNIARALYFDPEIVILDDPLSAVDAHVGKALFQDAIVGSLRNRGVTVILVTHALHFLSQCDYIYTMNNGVIAESGTYDQLISNAGVFARLDKEFGGHSTEDDKLQEDVDEVAVPHQGTTIADAKLKSARAREGATGTGKLEGRLMVKEKRATGSVSLGVYWTYLVAARGYVTAPLVVFFMVIMQSSQILNSYTLVWWEANTWNRPNSFYQILYGCLGVCQAIFTFFLGAGMDFMAFYVSQNLHHDAVANIFYAPMSFFDTTPMGRILSVFGKDIDGIDNQLALSMRLVVLTLSNVLGAVVIVTILEHYFIIAVVFIAFGYGYFAAFYRASAREIKRLDSMLRSILYAHFAETLTGLPTIRSYGEMKRFIRDNKYYVDLEDRALYLTVTNQRWLAIRLDFMGGILVFIVAVFAVVDVSGINAAQIGLVLTYTTSLSQMCGMVTRQTAEVENYMNSVERVVGYSHSNEIEQEAPHEIADRKPDSRWPMYGAIEFKDIKMSYRPGLPHVLKGISFSIKGGEKIGVVGRTGAGKSSLMLALFRIVELSAGSISIDGLDISSLGLKDLRTKVSIIPQDPLLFSGTIRSNLDPFSEYDDAHLWDALRRSYLIETPSDSEKDGLSATEHDTDVPAPAARFNLDSVIESEGANLSVGERSLLSLARALVKDSRVVVLDEATASVDLETDSKIQHTIQTEFKDRTLLCIAHRLRTIISYDRILVLDAGLVSEFDTPLNLFNLEGGIFRGMCERSNISSKEIEAAT